jgi:hypothetical protein
MFEAVGFVGGVLVTAGLVMILMAWGGMDERMPTQVPPRRLARYPIAAGALLLVVAAVGLMVPGAEGGWLRQQNRDCRSADGTSPPTSADLAPRRSALRIGWATAARSGQSVRVAGQPRGVDRDREPCTSGGGAGRH